MVQTRLPVPVFQAVPCTVLHIREDLVVTDLYIYYESFSVDGNKVPCSNKISMSNFWEMEVKSLEKGAFFFPSPLHSGTNGLMERFDLHANYKSFILTILMTIGQCLNDIIGILYVIGTIKKWSNLENLIRVYRCFIGDHHYLDFILSNFPFIVTDIIYVEIFNLPLVWSGLIYK